MVKTTKKVATKKQTSKKLAPNSKRPDSLDDIKKKQYIVLGIVGAPIIGWIIGALLNPDGWMSDPAGFVTGLLSVLIVFWPLSVPTLIAVIVLAVKKRYELMRTLMLVASICTAILVMMITASAEEDEFA